MYKFSCSGVFPKLVITEWQPVENYNMYQIQKCKSTVVNNMVVYRLEDDLYGCYLNYVNATIVINSVVDMDQMIKPGKYFHSIYMKVPCQLSGNQFQIIDPVYNAILFHKWLMKHNIKFRKVYCGICEDKSNIYTMNGYKLSNQIKTQLINLSGKMVLSKQLKVCNINNCEKIYVIVDGQKIKYLYRLV